MSTFSVILPTRMGSGLGSFTEGEKFIRLLRVVDKTGMIVGTNKKNHRSQIIDL